MRNDSNRMLWHAALLTLIVGSAAAIADDTAPQPAPASSPAPAQTPAPAAPTAAKPADKAAAKPAAQPAGKSDAGDDEGADYEKNAAKRFTPTERTPADKNVSFPVDI
jgi:hypothetical protein